MTTRLFGERVERREDKRLLVGKGQYTDDFESDAAHAAFVRSDYAHARIVDIDVSGALDVEGVHAVYTYEDLEGKFAEPLPLIIPHEAIADGRTQYALARDEVRYVGETIAMVVARDRYIAEDAAGAIVVKYEPLPVVAEIEDANAPDAPLVHRDRADNVVAKVAEEHGDVDAGFAASTHIFEWRLEIERSAATPLEGRGVVARFDEEGGLLVHDSTQAPTGIRAGLSRLLDLDINRVHVVAPDVGGGFGVKVIQFYPEEVMVPLAAACSGCRSSGPRTGASTSSAPRTSASRSTTSASAASDEGKILALETSFLHDSGAYCPYGLIIPIISAAQLPGPYRLDNYRYDFTALFTNRVATSPYRGAGRPHGAFVMERIMDHLARRARDRPRGDPPPQFHPAGRVPLRRRASRSRTADRPSTTPATTRPASTCCWRRSTTTASSPDGRRRAPRGGRSGSGSPATSRGPGSARTRARRSTSRSTAP